MLNPPNIQYNSIKIITSFNGIQNSQTVSLNSTYSISLSSTLQIKMTPTNTSLSRYEVRVTKLNDNYDIGVGNLAYFATNLSANTEHTININVTNSIFNQGNVAYRVSLYAQSAVDGSWDVTYLFFTSGNDKFIPSGSDGLETLVKTNL